MEQINLKRLDRIFCGIRTRCNNPNSKDYKNYGGRGIVCEWESYTDFKKDMQTSYITHVKEFGEIDTTIDRIDANGNYTKDNCKWATRLEQAQNCRRNKTIIAKDPEGNIYEFNCIRQFARDNDLDMSHIRDVLTGKCTNHKQWIFFYKEELKDINNLKQREKKNCKTFKATSPSGETIISNNMSEFAIEYGLTQPTISKVLNHKLKKHKGWQFEYVNEASYMHI